MVLPYGITESISLSSIVFGQQTKMPIGLVYKQGVIEICYWNTHCCVNISLVLSLGDEMSEGLQEVADLLSGLSSFVKVDKLTKVSWETY